MSGFLRILIVIVLLIAIAVATWAIYGRCYSDQLEAAAERRQFVGREKAVKRRAFHDRIWSKNVKVDISDRQDGSDVRVLKKPRSAVLIAVLIVAALFVACWFTMDLESIRLDFSGLWPILSGLFHPKATGTKTWERWWLYCWNTGFFLIWQTIEMTFIATVVGSIIAIPLFLLSARNIAKHWWIYQPVRLINDIFRTIPTLVLAIIATCFFGLNNLAGIIAMTIFTVGIMYKLMYEYIETLEMSPFEAVSSSGARTLQSVHLGLYPDFKPMFFSYILYTFEINIRASVILGFVGAGGIGTELEGQMTALCYDKVGALLVPLFLVVIVLQLSSNYVSRKLS